MSRQPDDPGPDFIDPDQRRYLRKMAIDEWIGNAFIVLGIVGAAGIGWHLISWIGGWG